MPSTTIALTPRQRKTITEIETQVKQIQANLNIFIAGIVQGVEPAPSDAAQIALTAEGITITEPEPVADPEQTPLALVEG